MAWWSVFSKPGWSDTLQSWISQGENLPISAEQFAAGVQRRHTEQPGEKAGIDPAGG